MKFLIDAQLPYGLKMLISSSGFDVIHTDDLPDKERTTDNQFLLANWALCQNGKHTFNIEP